MASTFAASESYGAGPTKTDTTWYNLLSASIASGSDGTMVPNANPIAVPAAGSAYSFERWVQAHFTGTFTSITSLSFYKYSGSAPTGVTLNAGAKGNQTYVTAVNTASSVATGAIPTSAGSLTGAYAAAFSDYFVIQAVVGTTGVAGNTNTIVYRYAWNEV
jgi:hypothetical protein